MRVGLTIANHLAPASVKVFILLYPGNHRTHAMHGMTKLEE